MDTIDTDNNIFDMLEYIIINTPSFPGQSASTSTSTACGLTPSTSSTDAASPKLEHKWSQNETKILIDLYGKYKNKLGTFQIKNNKMLWEKIASELSKFNIHVTPNNCLNRWKVLERNYKKFVDDQNKTGRGRKFFEYEAEMSELFGKKKNINPVVLLSTETKDTTLEDVQGKITKEGEEEVENQGENQKAIKTNISLVKAKVVKKKTTTLEKILLDRKEYHKSKLHLEEQKLVEIKSRNDLIEQRNLILREKNQILSEKKACDCCCNVAKDIS